jgi:methionine synthase I (cobalamin-dependent)
MSDFLAAARERVVIVDGAMGTSLQAYDLTPEDFDGLDGCNEVLVRTRPDVIREVHREFLRSAAMPWRRTPSAVRPGSSTSTASVRRPRR